MKNNFSNWFNIDKILSYNSMINFIIGERGVGKTFSASCFLIRNFLKTGNQFVYLRRYKTELKNAVSNNKFFDAIIKENIFPDVEFKTEGNKFIINGKIAGYAMALSTANIQKSSSYPKVKSIMFDEFMIDKGSYHYLINEVEAFLDLCETIFRLRDGRVLLLSNAISITNPYFSYFDLSLPYGSDTKLFKNKTILVHYIRNYAYRDEKKSSRFGSLIEGTKYSQYAIDNEFLRDSRAFIRKKTPASKFFFIFILNGHSLGVWIDYHEMLLFISKDYDPKCPMIFSLTNDDHIENTKLLSRRSPYYQSLINYYREGRLCFESQTIKNDVMNVLIKTLTY